MKKIPITNLDCFEKSARFTWLRKCETFWYGAHATWHYLRKNNQVEGIQIRWNGNPFELDHNYDYILEK